MVRYNYLEAVKEDVLNYIEENEIKVTESNKDDIYNDLYDDLFVHDSVTGNASGSYTFNAWQAEENLCHNFDLLQEAYEEFGSSPDLSSPESCDVSIRCYLLGQAITEVLDEIAEEEDEEEEDEE